MLNIIFPMAGEATRFGGEFKPFIKTGDMSFIERAVEPFLNHISDIDKFYFIITEEQNLSNNVEAVLNRMFDVSIEVVILKNKTTGPYQTIRSALNALSDKIQGEILICDCDHSIDVDYIFDNYRKYDCILPRWYIDIDEQDSWSKVVYHKNEIVMICEKETLHSPDMDIFGIIGCIYFSSLRSFEDLNDRFISDALKRELSYNSNIVAYDPRFGYFFGDPKRLAQYENSKFDRMTFFFDFDGTLSTHESQPEYETSNPLIDLNYLKELRDFGHRIVITTARSEKHRDKMIQLLIKYGYPYDDLLMDCRSGPRVLVNDTKPRIPFVKTAVAVNVERDSGFTLDIDQIYKERDYKIESTLGGYSPADKYVVNDNGRRFVRKIISKSVDEIHVKKLKDQYVNLKRFNFLWKDSTPEIYDDHEDGENYYFDMQYLPQSKGWVLLEESDNKLKHLENLLNGLNLNVYCMSKPVDGLAWIKSHISRKIVPKFSIDDSLIREILTKDTIDINGTDTNSVFDCIANLNYANFMPQKICPSHGDLTLENVFVNERTNSIKMIDPDGSDFYDVPELDMGKLGQSILMKYSSWQDDDWYDMGADKYDLSDKFFDHSGELQECLIRTWSNILVQDESVVMDKIILFSCFHLIRLIPFKLLKNRNHAIVSALLVRYWLSKLNSKGV
ncbi:hypothetical protein MK131_10225 [Candidatus Poribacteria bacterium]|nr:hypothetical protein [Candidatus Poribacteria bacterium]